MSIAWFDGKPWRVCLPTGGTENTANWKKFSRKRKKEHSNDWDDVLDVLGEDDARLHWHHIFSWCRESAESAAVRVCRGCYVDHMWCRYHACVRSGVIGFRPVLVPLRTDTLEPDPVFLACLKNGQTVTMGSLYMDDNALLPPTAPFSDGDIPDYRDYAELHIGDSNLHPTKRICWIKCGNHLISDRVLIKNISWYDLERNGFAVDSEGWAVV